MKWRGDEIGIHEGLKIPWAVMFVSVRVRPALQNTRLEKIRKKMIFFLKIFQKFVYKYEDEKFFNDP